MNKVEIKVNAYEAQLVDTTVRKIVEAAKTENVKFSGPVPLPTKREVFTILRSVHVNKKSREQFEQRTHKRLVVLKDPTSKLMDGLQRMEIPAGVQVNIITQNKDKK